MSRVAVFVVPIVALTAAALAALFLFGGERKRPGTSTVESAAVEPAPAPDRAAAPPSRRAAADPQALGTPAAAPAVDSPDPAAAPTPEVRPAAPEPELFLDNASVKLRDAQYAYVHGNYKQARDQARALLAEEPDNRHAWRMVGTSSCFLKEEDAARDAAAHLGERDQKFVAFMCKRNGITLGDAPAHAPPAAAHPDGGG